MAFPVAVERVETLDDLKRVAAAFVKRRWPQEEATVVEIRNDGRTPPHGGHTHVRSQVGAEVMVFVRGPFVFIPLPQTAAYVRASIALYARPPVSR